MTQQMRRAPGAGWMLRIDRRSLLLTACGAGLAPILVPPFLASAIAGAAICEQDACLMLQWGSGWAPPGRLSSPGAIALGLDGSLYVVDAGHDQIQRFDGDGQFLAQFGIPGTEQIPLQPRRELGDIAVHPSGDVYVIDAPITLFVPPGEEATPDRVVRFTRDGEFVQDWGRTGSAPGQFFSPTGIAIDGDGNVLVADAGNRRIQRFTPDGDFLTLWGSESQTVGERSTPVVDQKAPGGAVLVAPLRIAVSPDGTIWVSSLDGVRQFRPDGVLLGYWPPPRVDVGGGVSEGMDFDAAGNLHVSQSGTMPGHVLVYSPDGALQRDWEIPGFPSGIAIDAAGNVYVTGGSEAPLQKFDGQGTLLATWGGPNAIPAPGELDSPRGIAVDAAGNVYVADTGHRRVQRFDSEGTFLGQWTGASLGLGRDLNPFAVATGPETTVAILDDRRTILYVSREGRLQQEWPVTEGPSCSSVAVDHQGHVYVAADVVRVFDAGGMPLASWPTPDPDVGFRREPWAVAVDGAGHLYVTGLEPNAVSKFTTDGKPLVTWSGAGMGGEEILGFPELAVDAAGNVYVGHYTLVQKWSGSGELLASWDTIGPQEPGYPFLSGIAVDGDGYVYLTEGLNNLVKKFAQQGQAM